VVCGRGSTKITFDARSDPQSTMAAIASPLSSFSGASAPRPPQHHFRALGRSRSFARRPEQRLRAVGRRTATSSKNVLIINTKGGGHAFIGLYLAQNLLGKGHKVTILNDGDQAKVEAKTPYSEYSKVQGLDFLYADPKSVDTFSGLGDFDVVVENNGKDMENCQPAIDFYNGKIEQYIFVSSAGMYSPVTKGAVMPHCPGDEVKATAGHAQVESYLRQVGMPFSSFRPLYIYGPLTNKDCEQWFLDRIMRDRPVPIPAPGSSLCSVTHVEDVAGMLAAAIGNPNAQAGQLYNVCSDRYVTHDNLAKMLGKAAGKDVNIIHYDPEEVGGKKAFPFRPMHFIASPVSAMLDLGFRPEHDLVLDLPNMISSYVATGRMEKEPDFSLDDEIIKHTGSS